MTCICPDHHQKDKDGYPRMKYKQRLWRGNRLVYFLCYGHIPDNMVVAHKCNNTSCLNPEHFYLTTAENNSADAARDKLYRTGTSHPNNRWSDEDILEMKELYDSGFTQAAIGGSFGISQSRVSECIKRARSISE